MNIDILKMVDYRSNDKAINVAMPVLAWECEVSPPLENYLDAYEDAVLKLISIGLSSGISNALNITESMASEILDGLDQKGYATKGSQHFWEVTEAGEKYLNGVIEDRESNEAVFGYVFVNAIKKEVFPFFYQGDLNRAPLFCGQLPQKLLRNKSEEETFVEYLPDQIKLREAYKRFCKHIDTSFQYAEGEITADEAIDLFEDLETLEEDTGEPDNLGDGRENGALPQGNMFIRALKRKPQRVYLTMRILIDPQYPGGYRVESPFGFNGIDNGYYLRQIQWLAAAGETYIGEEKLETFLTREIRQFAPSYTCSQKDFEVFVLERMPLLKLQKEKFADIYEDMSRIYSLMRRADDLLCKENVVSSISRYVVERLFNEFFRHLQDEKLNSVANRATMDLEYLGVDSFFNQITKSTKINPAQLKFNQKYLSTVIYRLPKTRGNSIVEKFVNVLILNYYFGSEQAKLLLSDHLAEELYGLVDRLNRIRRKVSHDTEEKFTAKDYDDYTKEVFSLINYLLSAFKEAL